MRLLALAGIVAVASTGCFGGGDKVESRAADISFEEATQRAFDAVNRPGFVFYLRMELRAGGEEVLGEVWVDVENRRARSDLDGDAYHLYVEGCDVTSREGSRGLGGAFNADSRDPLLTEALDYLDGLEDDLEVVDREIVVVSIGGEDGYRLRTTVEHTGDFAGTNVAELYLDAEFLPVRLDLDTSLSFLGALREEYESEFVEANTLPPGFFSITNLESEDLSNHVASCEVNE